MPRSEILRTSQTPLQLFDSLSEHINLDGSVQYFYPYRGYRKEILRVVLDSPYSIMFDLYKNGSISFFNDISENSFLKYRDKFFNGNIDSAEKFALDKLKKYKTFGVHTIAKGKDFLQIQTVFIDSSFELLNQVDRNYKDSFYSKMKKEHSDLKGYCLAYYLFDDGHQTFPYFSPRRLIKINDRLYYYRESLLQ